jgi:hypothetical protein
MKAKKKLRSSWMTKFRFDHASTRATEQEKPGCDSAPCLKAAMSGRAVRRFAPVLGHSVDFGEVYPQIYPLIRDWKTCTSMLL